MKLLPMAEQPSDWTYDTDPPLDGWYAVIRCLDSIKGRLFPGAALWSGCWDQRGSEIRAHAGPFDSKESALVWANTHDPAAP